MAKAALVRKCDVGSGCGPFCQPPPHAQLQPARGDLHDLFLKCLTGFWRMEPDDEGLSGEDILVPRLGVRVLIGLFH